MSGFKVAIVGATGNVGREMLASGDWVTPRLDAIKYFEKPALGYWATAVAFEVDPRQTDSIAEGLLRVATDEDERKRLHALGLERAADFGWEKCATEVLALFNRLDRA